MPCRLWVWRSSVVRVCMCRSNILAVLRKVIAAPVEYYTTGPLPGIPDEPHCSSFWCSNARMTTSDGTSVLVKNSLGQRNQDHRSCPGREVYRQGLWHV